MRKIEQSDLTPVVAQALGDKTAAVLDWQQRELQGGTVGEVHLLEGQARTATTASRPWSLVVKIQRPWTRWGDPECWRRELRLYQSDFFATWPPSLHVPTCYKASQQDDGEIWLWLETVEGSTGSAMTIDDYSTAARCLAHLQGRYLTDQALPDEPWLGTRRWLARTLADWGTQAFVWLESSRQQTNGVFPADLIEDTLRLWHQRDDFLDIAESFPRTLCHRDFNPANLFVQGTARTCAIDWDCAGPGAIGEDIGDLIGEALVFEGFPPAQIGALQESVLTEYHAGLRQTGWQGSYNDILLSFAAHAALQWSFRIPCRAKDEEDPDRLEQYRQAQRYVLDLAQQARDLRGQTS